MLNFESSGPTSKGKKKSLKIVFGIGALVGIYAIGSTLAASINLNSGTPVEFGQGVTQTTACDDEITVTPFSTFVNETGSGSHKLTSIKISGIDSSQNKCNGKIFRIKAYNDNNMLALVNYKKSEIFSHRVLESVDYAYVEITDTNGVFTWTSGGTDGDDVISGSASDLTDTSFTLSLTSETQIITRTPLAMAESVKSITVETVNKYQLGDTGPGGGKIFYYAEAGFSCGPTISWTCHYLESAPNNWSGGGSDPQRTWSSVSNQSILVDGADRTEIGSGFKNSLAIVGQDGNLSVNSAAVLAHGFSGGGNYDWYLPSKDELDQLFAQQSIVGGFLNTNNYWSSSEISGDGAWNQNFGSGEQGSNGKFDERLIRPIRAF